MNLLENYLQLLYLDKRAAAKEWRGANLPVEGDCRPNWIRKCMMLESDRMKINCLRKLRDQAAMNPFYQYRIDRFVDAITQTWEPTEKPGTIPGNEFKASNVGEDLTEAYLSEITKQNIKDYGPAAFVSAAIILAAAEALYRTFSKKAKNCAGLSIGQKNVCMWKYKIDGIKAEINFLKSRISKCKEAKKPEKCMKAVKRRIANREKALARKIKQYETWEKYSIPTRY